VAYYVVSEALPTPPNMRLGREHRPPDQHATVQLAIHNDGIGG
jgi:hypothetical protein